MNTTNNDGRITRTTASMEYSADSGVTWTPCVGTEVSSLTPQTYQVRTGSSGTTIVSAPINVTVGPYAPSTVMNVTPTGVSAPVNRNAVISFSKAIDTAVLRIELLS